MKEEKKQIFTTRPNGIFFKRFAVIAGSGNLPISVFRTLHMRGENPLLVVLRGEAEKYLYNFEHHEISVVEFSHLIRILRTNNIKQVILAGGIRHRPKLRELSYDFSTLYALPKLIFALNKGDDALLRTFIDFIEKYGFHVVGAHEIVPELLAPFNTILTNAHPDTEQKNDIELAVKEARQLGKQDIGQAVVIMKGKIIAKEDIKGTDVMLESLLKYPPLLSSRGILVKTAKPNQEMRVDLPTIGPKTVENSYKAKLQGIVVEGGSSFILNRKETIRLANAYGIFIVCL